MAYLENSLGKDEEIKCNFQFHYFIKIRIVTFYVLCFPLVFISVLYLTLVFITIIYHLSCRKTEMGITNKRAVLKKGIIAINTEELILKQIETVEIKQGIIGRIFDYGNVKMTGTGNSILVYKNIAKPLDVKKMIESLLA